MPVAWRIVKARHALNAWDGEGARRHGGRWSSPGVRVVYAAESIALATLEILVHVGAPSLLAAYVVCRVEIPDEHLERLGSAALPADWRASPPPAALQRIGNGWVKSGRTPALAVPSAVVPLEANYLLNPAHPAFAELVRAEPQALSLDPRLGAPPAGGRTAAETGADSNRTRIVARSAAGSVRAAAPAASATHSAGSPSSARWA